VKSRLLTELAPGVTAEEVKEKTTAEILIPAVPATINV
jgi:acyl CoA:acetate/3-ketoacid CoA transferase beta subunit